MSIYHIPWRMLLSCFCIIGLIPMTSVARDNDNEDHYPKSIKEALSDEKQTTLKQRIQQQTEEREQPRQKESLKDRSRYQTQPRQAEQRKQQRHERPDQDTSLKERTRYQTRPRQSEQRELEYREQPAHDQSLKQRIQQQTQHQIERRERSDRDHPSRSTPRRIPRSSHDRYYEKYSTQLKRRHHYYQHENYRYHTYFLAPIKRHYPPLDYRVTLLPRTYVRIVVSGWPYFYYDGIFYRQYIGGYIVVRAPIGAVVNLIPLGFIAFSLGGFTYYYVNDTYYIWDEEHEAYVVVDKPDGAEKAMAEATEGRIFAYPKQGQSEEQQAKDRYECHRWAVSETGVDPTIVDEDKISLKDKRDYRRAISACLEGRGYSVR